jgi:hypothetical protein
VARSRIIVETTFILLFRGLNSTSSKILFGLCQLVLRKILLNTYLRAVSTSKTSSIKTTSKRPIFTVNSLHIRFIIAQLTVLHSLRKYFKFHRRWTVDTALLLSF